MKRTLYLLVLTAAILTVSALAQPADMFCHRTGVAASGEASKPFDDMYRDVCTFSDGRVHVTEVIGDSLSSKWYSSKEWRAELARELRIERKVNAKTEHSYKSNEERCKANPSAFGCPEAK